MKVNNGLQAAAGLTLGTKPYNLVNLMMASE
jgi:hypothetical protein